jgi:DNA primase
MTITQSTLALSLADLEAHDPRAASGGVERVSRCPICQSSERAFHFNTESGVYNCKRASCGATGKLKDFWTDRPKTSRRQRTGAALNRVFALSTAAPDNAKPPTNKPAATTWREQLERVVPLQSTPGGEYLTARGLPVELAASAGVRFSPNWSPRASKESREYSGGAAVVYPLRNKEGALVAASGRYIAADAKPKTRTGGAASAGVFATPGALRCEVVTICEGPADALSLAACGFAAVAVNGCNLPDWLPHALAFKRVLIASDVDDGGDRAAIEWIATLQSIGARCERLRPHQVKDWNEMLQRDGQRAMTAHLAARLKHIQVFNWRM